MTTTVTTGLVRLSYVHLTEPHSFTEGQQPKYSCTVLLPKSDTKTKAVIDAAIKAATAEGTKSKWGGTQPARVSNPLHDGDGERPSDGGEYSAECKGHWVFNASASTKRKPGIVDVNLNDITDATEIYSGIYAKVHLSFFAYSVNGKKGIGCSILNVQKIKDGESLGNTRANAKDVFKVVEVDPITGELVA